MDTHKRKSLRESLVRFLTEKISRNFDFQVYLFNKSTKLWAVKITKVGRGILESKILLRHVAPKRLLEFVVELADKLCQLFSTVQLFPLSLRFFSLRHFLLVYDFEKPRHEIFFGEF